MDLLQSYLNIIDNLYDGVYYVDTKRQILYWNDAAEKITGFKKDEVLNKFCFENILKHIDSCGTELCLKGCPLENSLKDGKIRELKIFLHHKNGHRVPVTVKSIPIYGEDSKIHGAIEIFSTDTSNEDFIKKIEELEKIAMLDTLTSLPNRRYCENFLENKLNEFIQLKNPFGVLFIDIDHFKGFNDTYGHDVGDLVLKTVAKTLSHNIHGQNLISRWGGEEFLAVISGGSEKVLMSFANEIRSLIENSSIYHQNKELNITISVGGAIIKNKEDIAAIIKRADKNLYTSKETGRNKVTI